MTRGAGGYSPANITHHLKGIDFPARKQDLVTHARQNQADEAVLKLLEALPEQEYRSMADVMKAYGEIG
jgi:hypothetical protein